MPQFPRFWAWYERHYVVNVIFAASLFTLQLVHLYWLTTDIVFLRLFDRSFFSPTPFWEYLIIAVDFAEIPAIIITSIFYVHEWRKEERLRSLAYLFFINSQWLHIFWITDEFIVSLFREVQLATILPLWLAWVAIFIDYLELPVIVDTIRKASFSLRRKKTFWERLKNAARTYLWRL